MTENLSFPGGIAVGLFYQLGHEEISKVALECKADIIVVENENLLKKVLLVQHKLPDLRAIVQLSGEPPLSDKRRLHKSHKVRKHILRHGHLTPKLEYVVQRKKRRFLNRSLNIDEDLDRRHFTLGENVSEKSDARSVITINAD